MALAKEQTNSQAGLIQLIDSSSIELFGFKGPHNWMLEGGCSESLGSFPMGHLPTLSDPSNSTSSNFVFGAVNSSVQEAQSILNFKAGLDNCAFSSSPVLRFEHGDRVSHANHPKLGPEEECALWIDAMDQNYQLNQLNLKCGADSHLMKDANCFEMANGYGLMSSPKGDNRPEARYGWLYHGATVVDNTQESGGPDEAIQKRPNNGVDMQAPKKHCGGSRKTMAKAISSKDPQSVVAKLRRERISERLKTLQDLVPNGTKVDLVTMLEKAISYVKFLQLQVKVLATDEFWPAQGGKAPEVAQVKEAIDAILSSHKR